jgi:hypothetical protein
MYVSKRKKLIWVIIVAMVLGAIALIILLPRQGDLKDAGGTMSINCPIKVYQQGEVFKSPCPLRPQENCMFTDGNNCQYDMRNVGSQPFNKGEPVIVVRQRIQGLIQILEVNVVE